MSGRPRPLVLCGPSGSGKSTLLQRLLAEHPTKFGFSVSHTTRRPRPGEEDGIHYHFTDNLMISEAIDRGEFLENAVYGGNTYGTSRSSVEKVLDEGKVCVLDIDVQGAEQVKNTDMNPLMLFVRPPSLDELERRLRARNTETESSLAVRLQAAQSEIDYGLTPRNFHYIIINEDVEKAYDELKNIIFKEVQFL